MVKYPISMGFLSFVFTSYDASCCARAKYSTRETVNHRRDRCAVSSWPGLSLTLGVAPLLRRRFMGNHFRAMHPMYAQNRSTAVATTCSGIRPTVLTTRLALSVTMRLVRIQLAAGSVPVSMSVGASGRPCSALRTRRDGNRDEVSVTVGGGDREHRTALRGRQIGERERHE